MGKNGYPQTGILRTLGIHYRETGNFAECEDILENRRRNRTFGRDFGQLADLYRKHSKTDQFIATLEKILKLPDYGLSRGKTSRGKLRSTTWSGGNSEAPYAEAAAESYSCRSLKAVALCYEAVHRWKEADDTWKAVVERYPDNFMGWYWFCKRTGHGDVEAARTVFLSASRNPATCRVLPSVAIVSLPPTRERARKIPGNRGTVLGYAAS